jgi:hypothetical protein
MPLTLILRTNFPVAATDEFVPFPPTVMDFTLSQRATAKIANGCRDGVTSKVYYCASNPDHHHL